MTDETLREKRAYAGRIGGLKRVAKGFALDRELASRAGRVGGKKSRRKKGPSDE